MPWLRVQNGIDRIVEQFTIVADDHGGVGIFLQPRLEPQRAFEIEIVGRLVEQKKLGLREQRGGQRHPHAPAAGKFRHRPGEIVVGKTKPAQDFGGACRGTVGVDGIQSLIDFGKLFRFRRFELRIERFASRVGGKHGVDAA